VGYYVRAFCTSKNLPRLGVVVAWAKERGADFRVVGADLDLEDWREAEIAFSARRQPLVVESETGELLKAEIEEFREFLEDVEDSPAKARVLKHLERCERVVAVQILGEIHDDVWAAAWNFLAYFVEHLDGLLQADDVGFYEGTDIAVELS
jgi:hypothetical protein